MIHPPPSEPALSYVHIRSSPAAQPTVPEVVPVLVVPRTYIYLAPMPLTLRVALDTPEAFVILTITVRPSVRSADVRSAETDTVFAAVPDAVAQTPYGILWVPILSVPSELTASVPPTFTPPRVVEVAGWRVNVSADRRPDSVIDRPVPILTTPTVEDVATGGR